MWTRERIFEIVNLIGSIASIMAIAILAVGWFVAPNSRDAETIVWQCVLFGIALAACAAIVLVCGIWIGSGRYPPKNARDFVTIFAKICVCLIGLGIAGDGMVAAIEWRMWPHIPLNFLHFWWMNIFR
jgi:hypothetical protein